MCTLYIHYTCICVHCTLIIPVYVYTVQYNYTCICVHCTLIIPVYVYTVQYNSVVQMKCDGKVSKKFYMQYDIN